MSAPKILQKEAAFNAAALEPLLQAMAVAEKDKFGNFSLFSIPFLEKENLNWILKLNLFICSPPLAKIFVETDFIQWRFLTRM